MLFSPGSSDEEVFIGKASARETLRRVQLGRRTISVVTVSDESEDSSVELIEAQSEPEFLVDSPSPEKPLQVRRSLSQPDLRVSLAQATWESMITDDSFVAMETRLMTVDNSATSDELDNTLERIEKLLETGSQEKKDVAALTKQDTNTPFKGNEIKSAASLKKPALRTPLFKTPLKPNRWGVKTTPCRSPRCGPSPFSSISSPVGFYMKHTSQAPLMQSVKPKRPLPGPSAIPILQEKPVIPRGKENVVRPCLPSKAYVKAKQTKLIVTPDSKQFPRKHQVNIMASTLAHPNIVRHERREGRPAHQPALNKITDESFAKLSLSQADVSVCVTKSAGVSETLKRN